MKKLKLKRKNLKKINVLKDGMKMDARNEIKLRVVIADDITKWRDTTSRYVRLVCEEEKYCNVESFDYDNTEEAFNAVDGADKEGIIPLLITDIHFTKEEKDGKGLDLIKRIRQSERLNGITIIGMTSDREYKERIEQLGSRYVPKPEFRDAMYDTLKMTLEEKLGS